MAKRLPPLDIVVWNTDSSDDGVKEFERQESMDYILSSILQEEHQNLFLLCQDKITNPKQEILNAMFDGYVQKNSNKLPRTAIYYYSNDFNVQEVPENTDVHLALLVLTAKDRPEQTESGPRDTEVKPTRILLASWHAKYKTKAPNKIDSLGKLLLCLEDFKNSKRCDFVVLGGDFNQDIMSVNVRRRLASTVNSIYPLCIYESEIAPDRRDLEKRDFLVFWPDKVYDKVGPVQTPFNDYKRETGKRPFDHPILTCMFRSTVCGLSQLTLDDSTFVDLGDLTVPCHASGNAHDASDVTSPTCTWPESHRSAFSYKLEKAKRLYRDAGASVVFTFGNEMTATSARAILDCLPKHHLYRANRKVVIRTPSEVLLQESDGRDLFVSRLCKEYTLQTFHNNRVCAYKNAVYVYVYGLFRLEGYAPIHHPKPPAT
ncbi:hypothetical protein BaRGS_00038264 [Batillaria attramentaria]|uniref:Endonuclease/exonuclease/phosphatase domain-containing protein n=1 Tax=Batillaria attramentaria TaxID=370345 RepID=A0ABD0J6B6_9CAEN